MSISLDEPNVAIPPNDVIIESDHFRGKRISCTALGSTSILTSSASNRVSFEMPSLPSGELLTIRVDGSDCGSPIIFTFESQYYTKSRKDMGLKVSSSGTNRYNISVDCLESTDILEYNSDCTTLTAIEVPEWTLEVHDAMNNQKIMEINVVGDSYILDMSAFNPGIYAVRAVMGDKVATGKIYKQ